MAEPILGGTKEYHDFLNSLPNWDKYTLIDCWRKAHKFKDKNGVVLPHPLIVRRMGLNNAEIIIIKPDELPRVQTIKKFSRMGWLRTPVPRGTVLVFWSAIQPQEDVGQFHKEDAKKSIAESPKEITLPEPVKLKKKRGRPKIVRDQGQVSKTI